jgi:hypothetical protein
MVVMGLKCLRSLMHAVIACQLTPACTAAAAAAECQQPQEHCVARHVPQAEGPAGRQGAYQHLVASAQEHHHPTAAHTLHLMWLSQGP